MTNEEYLKAIEQRCSRRTYKPMALDKDTMDVIKSMVELSNEKGNLNFRFVEDATPAFKLFTGRFSCIAICGDDKEQTRINAGYYGEMIVLQCVYHALGTCWVTGTYNENKMLEMLKLPRNERLYGVIVVGYVKDKLSSKEKMMYKITHKVDKSYQRMIEVCDKKLPQAFEYAMKLVEKAPSGTNSKPVKFRYEDGQIRAYVDQPYSDKSISFGIAQLHFKIGAALKGVKGDWDFSGRFIVNENSNKVIKFPENEQ